MSDLPGLARPWHGPRFSSVLDAYKRITGEADHQFRRERVGVALPTPDGTWERLLWQIRMYAYGVDENVQPTLQTITPSK
jgi:hypothetical protein